MSAKSYPIAIKCVLAHEGGYTNHPRDPGGPTNWGITIYDARKYWKPNATAADVKAMPLSVAQTIYKARYWDALRCDELPAGLDYTVFDYGVNSGIGRAGKVLRRVLGMSDGDYHVTDAVLAEIARRDVSKIISAVNDERLRFLRSLSTWPTFGKGWGARVADVKRLSLSMAANAPVPEPVIQAAPERSAGVVPKPAIAQPAAIPVAAAVTASAGAAAHGWSSFAPSIVWAGAAAVITVAAIAIGITIYRHRGAQEAPTPGLVPVPAT